MFLLNLIIKYAILERVLHFCIINWTILKPFSDHLDYIIKISVNNLKETITYKTLNI